MRAVWSLLLAVLPVAFLAGCGQDAGAPKPGAPKKLTLWHIQTKSPMKDVVAAAVRRFEAAHPGVTVEVLAFENDAFKSKLATALAAGSGPDAFHTWGGGTLAAAARAGHVLDLSGRVPADRLGQYAPRALDICRADGKLLALPADIAVVVFWYNREVFEKHGLKPPATWQEFLAACDKLKAAGVTPIALGNSDSWPGAFYFAYLATRLGGKEPFADALARRGQAGFEHEAFVSAGRMSAELAGRGAFSEGFSGMDYTRARGLFFQGRAAMMLMGTYLLGNLRDEAPAGFAEKLGCFAFPAVEGGKGDASLVLGGVNAGYAVSSRCSHTGEAAALIMELTSVATGREWAATRRIPALDPKLLEGALASETCPAAEILARARDIQLYYDQALPPELAQEHKSTAQALLGGSKTPEEAARLMEQKARAIAEREKK
ncbi:MAG TPA: extracellular solute-binding protein [Planctomycetota bacterium]|nr:extracellular solute-binding protein [Planctomycetota bacterium]